MPRPDPLKLHRDQTVLLVIDVQERLSAAMDQPWLDAVVKNTRLLIETAKVLGLPVLVTEQYPRGLGPTLKPIAEAFPEGQPLLDKVCFSCLDAPALADSLRATGRKQVLLTGMETHVCVFQTARDLVREGYAPWVVEDAVLSRTRENHAVGLRLMARAGAVRTGTETTVFDLLGKAGTPEFKALSPLVK